MKCFKFSLFALLTLVCQGTSQSQDYHTLERQTIRDAIDSVADCVVQIRTVGGLERVGDTLLSQGPTSGLIVSDDGYIVSSAFNFAQQPSSILVRLPSGQQVPAELVAHDKNRMLVLLKVTPEQPLPVPEVVPSEEIAPGQWSIALGRTFQTEEVDVSLGVISALGRMYGRVIQTDASISAANYGGPLVDIHGRVLGVLVPMSPQTVGDSSESAVAGAEFYDSGIGFAVPLEHVQQILDRWKQGEDLYSGKLGIGLKSGSPYLEPAKITSVWPGSPADQAEWKTGDTIIAVNGKPVATQAELRFQLKPRYAGETITVSIERGAEEFDNEVVLAEKLAPFQQAFLGVIPSRTTRQEQSSGVLVGGVWPASPAAQAGIQPDDELTGIDDVEINSFALASAAVGSRQAGKTVSVTLQRNGEELSVETTLSTLPTEILASEDLPALPERKGESGGDTPLELQPLKIPEFSQEAKYYKPSEREGLRSGLVIWLAEKKDFEKIAADWRSQCERHHFTLLLAHPADDTGWRSDDLQYLVQLVRAANTRLDVDASQTVIGGSAKAGQLAYAFALRKPGQFSGVVGDNAPLPRNVDIPENSPSTQLAILTIEPNNSSFSSLIRNDVAKLQEAGYPVSRMERLQDESLNGSIISSITRWMAGLVRF